VNKQQMRDQRLALYELPDYRPRQNKHNDYGFNPYEQRNETYTGMGSDINVHDQWAVESQGAIQDRTREHLGTTDKGIIAFRKQLVEAIEANQRGEKTLMMIDAAQASALSGPPSIDGVSDGLGADEYWRGADAMRREESEWASQRK
jgi:phthalate 4,5-dioxygenase oxygenase subunit